MTVVKKYPRKHTQKVIFKKPQTSDMRPTYHSLSLLFIFLGSVHFSLGQQNIRTFIFGHSLIHHEAQVNETPSQETSVPHWFVEFTKAAGHNYAVGGQYGFLPQHANVPPISQWGFDSVAGAWESDTEPFSDADFTNILITPGNFIQWQGPDVNYFGDDISPLDATNTIINWTNTQEDDLKFYIYENWPDMGGYLNNGFPPTAEEWTNYNTYLQADFHDWFIEYHDSLIISQPNNCISMIPVGPIISKLLMTSPFNQIPIDSLYEDDAPHGRPTIYFLAALTTYMAMTEEVAPNYIAPSIIHPIVGSNYQTVVNFIWDELHDFDKPMGNSRVFCSPVTELVPISTDQITTQLFPNPASHSIQLVSGEPIVSIEISDILGNTYHTSPVQNDKNSHIDIQHLPNGIYFVRVNFSKNSTVKVLRFTKDD